MERNFDHMAVECDWYEWWVENRMFEPKPAPPDGENGAGPAFSMILPPPNVTGALHIGHALTITVQDALARWQRMRGVEVLWIPGLDHAGIATQAVVEKRLLRDEGLTRHDLGREAFVARVQGWRDEYGSRIERQVQRMGASLDWDRRFFTLDEQRSSAVNEAFRLLFMHGVVFRGSMLVNWCPALRTAISDIEVEVKQLDGPTTLTIPAGATAGKRSGSAASREVELGWMELFEYAVAEDERPEAPGSSALRDTPSVVRVATTRLETMLGDAAVAVHPDDPRYAGLVGRALVHPLTGRRLPVVADAELVDMGTGTGAVKVTPAHDAADFACGQRHQLPVWSVLDEAGCIVSPHGAGALVPARFVGLDRFEARAAVREALRECGAYAGREPRAMAVAVCSRSGDVLEPLVRPQWWVATEAMAARALADVAGGRTAMQPAAAGREWAHWLQGGAAGSSRDWCVSRQLWWGHRIPAWRVQREPSAASARVGGPLDGRLHRQWRVFEGEEWVVAADAPEALRVAAAASLQAGCVSQAASAGIDLGAAVSGVEQDEDVLDTWFSSGLLPLSALGWPREGGGLDPELARFYPLSVMETGQDILFFWVARMAMLCAQLPQLGDAAADLVAASRTGGAALGPGDPCAAGLPAEAPPPFRRVLLHGMVRDAEGRKMSKSLGNVIDPLAVADGRALEAMLGDVRAGNVGAAERARAEERIRADFPEGLPGSGVDAMRGALLHLMQGSGQDVSMDLRRVHGWRLFANKLWNASRFIVGSADEALQASSGPAAIEESEVAANTDERAPASSRAAVSNRTAPGRKPSLGIAGLYDLRPDDPLLPLHSRWLMHRVASEAAAIHGHLQAFDLGAAAARVMSLVHSDLCDVGIEWSKPALRYLPGHWGGTAYRSQEEQKVMLCRATLAAALDGCLRLAHPMMPFLTEELWQRLHRLGTAGSRPYAPEEAGLPLSVSLSAFPACGDGAGAGTCDLSAWLHPELDAQMDLLVAVVAAARAAASAAQRITGNASRSAPKRVMVECATEAEASLVEANKPELCSLLLLEPEQLEVEVPGAGRGRAAGAAAAGWLMHYAAEGVRAGVRLPGGQEAAGALRTEVVRLAKRRQKRGAKMRGMRERLAAPGFAKAAEAVQQAQTTALAEEEAADAAEAELIETLEAAIAVSSDTGSRV